METLPFLINSNSAGARVKPINPASPIFQENWLQELLRLHPDILPVAEIEPVFYPLIPIGREVPVTAGYIDNLFISQAGYPVVVETKLWRNPEAKRDVLAQLIDYASSISGWTYEQLDQITRKYTRQYESKVMGLIDWVGAQSDFDGDSRFFEETVSRNLRLGRILVLVVGDRIRSSVIDMLSYINKYPHLEMNVALIELRCFRLKDEGDWPLLVVPSILAKTEIIERSIVQVNVNLEGTVKISATQEKLKGSPTQMRSSMAEDDFWQRMKNQDPESLEPAQRLIDYYRDNPAVTIRTRGNSLAAHLHLPETGQRISLFFIRTDGVIVSWPGTIAAQLEKGGLDRQMVDEYFQDIAEILKSSSKKQSIYYPLKKVDVDRLVTVVDHFIDMLIQAEPVIDS